MSSFKETIEKIRILEAEKRNLLFEIEELKEAADAKATALESEVSALRDEVRALRNLMNEPEANADKKAKK